tara:strand:- start:3511 stop:4260 length:750 start_codon:yes stop_codon:yes gene_type:complete
MFYDHEFIGAMLVHEFQMGNDYFEKANPKDYTLDEIMKRTEIKIKPKLDLEEFKGKSCAIVGSSPKLLEQELGEEIDSHDYVVRFNLSRTDGYEKHTGSKTNFRVISGKSFGYIDNPGYERHDFDFFKQCEGEHFILKPRSDGNFRHIVGGLINNIDTLNPISVIPVTTMNDISTHFEHMVEPSCGFLGTMVFMECFENINLYGFDWYEDTDNLHYYEKVDYTEKVHSFQEEKEYIQLLSQTKIGIEIK